MLAKYLLICIMIIVFNDFANRPHYIGDKNGAQGICSFNGRKYLDIG